MGLPRVWIGYAFLFATIALYAGIGIMSRTADVAEYYVAGRRVPALFNGMATGADWMSAASFIGMAGGLYLQGFDGLAFIMGWTGGYCLVAFLLAPYLRKFGQFTIPDFLGARYGGNIARFDRHPVARSCARSPTWSRRSTASASSPRASPAWRSSIGVFLGLAGILVCSFLGGMRAVTWTQVAQYIILIIAYMIPVVWLAVKHTGIPLPQLVYGRVLAKVTEREKQLTADPKELEVRNIFKTRADDAKKRIDAPAEVVGGGPGRGRQEGRGAEGVERLGVRPQGCRNGARQLSEVGRRRAECLDRRRCRGCSPARHHRCRTAKPYYSGKAGEAGEKERDTKRLNFLALTFCLMLGTAALPHILMRYYTTPSVKQARASVTWSLFFIFLLYFTAPALAVLVKFDIYTILVGKNVRRPAGVGGVVGEDRSAAA